MSKLQAVLTLTAVLTIGNIAQAQSGSRNSYPAAAPAITNGYTPSVPPSDYGYSRYPAQDDYTPAVRPFGQAGQVGQPVPDGRTRRPCHGSRGGSLETNYNSRETYTPVRRGQGINSRAGSFYRDDFQSMDREFPGYDYGSTYRPARDYGNQDYSRDLRSRELNGRPRTYSNPEPGYPSSGFGPGYGYTSTGRTSGIRWQTELTPAAEFALQNRRPMIITVTAPWCSYCKKLKSESFEDAGFVRSVNAAQYVSVKIDSDVNKDLVSRMGIRSLPTTLIVSPDLRIVERMEGFRTAEQLSLSLRRHARTALKDSSVIIAKK